METLIAFLFSNLIPVIIVVSIIVRIVLSAKKAAERRKESPPVESNKQNTPPKKERPGTPRTLLSEGEEGSPPAEAFDAWRLEPDEDDEPLPVFPGNQAGLLRQAAFSPAAVADTGFGESSLIAEPAGVDRPPRPSREPHKTPHGAAVFPHIDALPPLRRAVILAEILGTPKGMQQ
ncbi:MAG: hypothetical protein LBT16_08005 [Treponema sp.]|jgi:hypothetical protein|nr:hypothetical protein [Treponema sp.]